MSQALNHALPTRRRSGGAGLALALGLVLLGLPPLSAQTTRRAKPAGSGVPAASIPVARAQPNAARQVAILTTATPMALPNGEASGAPSPSAGATAGLDPRVFRVDPRDEIITVSPLEPPRIDYGNSAVAVAPQPAPRRSPSAVPPPAVTRITIEPAPAPEAPSAEEPPRGTRITVAPAPDPQPELEPAEVAPAPPIRPDPELDKRSARRSRARAVREGTVATLSPGDLMEYSRQPARVKHVIKNALALTDMGLGYKFGSADASRGGMDCSGAVFATLSNAGMRGHPRDSFSQYEWLVEHGRFHAARAGGFGKFSMEKLRPGDLLFWVNTYRTKRNPPVTHVAIYLGREKGTGRHVMMHAGGGRKYNGKSRRGVTVANFEYPDRIGARGGKGSFLGWGSIPGVR